MFIYGLELCGLLVDYCDAFISCLDSHSGGTHSPQRINWWAINIVLNFYTSAPSKKQIFAYTLGDLDVSTFSAIWNFGVNLSFKMSSMVGVSYRQHRRVYSWWFLPLFLVNRSTSLSEISLQSCFCYSTCVPQSPRMSLLLSKDKAISKQTKLLTRHVDLHLQSLSHAWHLSWSPYIAT